MNNNRLCVFKYHNSSPKFFREPFKTILYLHLSSLLLSSLSFCSSSVVSLSLSSSSLSSLSSSSSAVDSGIHEALALDYLGTSLDAWGRSVNVVIYRKKIIF